MLKNYLKISLRNLQRHKAYSFINVAGLAIGLACFTLIILYVQDEWSYDRYHEDADQVYRLAVEIQANEGATRTAQSPPIWPGSRKSLLSSWRWLSSWRCPWPTSPCRSGSIRSFIT